MALPGGMCRVGARPTRPAACAPAGCAKGGAYPGGHDVNQVVLFVCPHGAAKSRMAAAFFNQVAPSGWTATSAGLDPAAELSPTAARLLAGTDAEPLLDHAPPRTISSVESANRVVGIDCAPAGG